MAGMLAASMRVPPAAVVMEMTGSYGLIVPLMLTTIVAYALGRRWGVYPEQVAGIEQSPAHVGEAVVGLLETWTVREAMERPWPYAVEPQVIAVQNGEGEITAPPDPDRPLRADDVLVMIPRDQSATKRPST